MYHVCAIALVTFLSISKPDSDSVCPWVDKSYTGKIIGVQKFDDLNVVVIIRFVDGSQYSVPATWEELRLYSISIQAGTPVQCTVDQVRSCAQGRQVLACRSLGQTGLGH